MDVLGGAAPVAAAAGGVEVAAAAGGVEVAGPLVALFVGLAACCAVALQAPVVTTMATAIPTIHVRTTLLRSGAFGANENLLERLLP